MFLSVPVWFLPFWAAAQEGEQEVVANLSTGRVVLAVGKDGIVIGAAEEKPEPGSRPPLVVLLGPRRIGVVLGAAEWVWPAGGRAAARLDRELMRITREMVNPQGTAGYERAGDIEALGVGVLERLRDLAGHLHRKLNLKPDEPVLELILADYEEGYGPEVWVLRYRVAQEALRGDYWRTRVLRPSYTQLYPPEKHQPHVLMELHYPPEESSPDLLDLLRQNDPRLAALRSSDPAMARAADFLLKGESQRAAAGEVAGLLHAALPVVTSPEAKLVLGVLYLERPFDWILAPPEPVEKADEGKPREPGAPTLRNKKPPP